MTIPVEQVRYVYTGPYVAGDILPIPFSYREVEHVLAATADRVLIINIDYSVLGQNLTLLTPIPADSNIVIYRQTPLNNEAEFPQEAEFDSEKINDSIDKLTMIVQEQQDSLNRALQIPTFVPSGELDTFIPSPSAGKCLKWDVTGTTLINSIYDPDRMILEAESAAQYAAEQANRAVEQANRAVEQATIATEKATIATEKAEEVAAIAIDTYSKSETYSQVEVNNLLDQKQDIIDTYTKEEVNSLLITKADVGSVYTKEEVYTKNEVYPTTNTYTKSEVDALIAEIPGGGGDTYSKTEIDTKLNAKQNKLYNGTYAYIQHGTVDTVEVDVNTLMVGFYQSDWDMLSDYDRLNIPLALIYE